MRKQIVIGVVAVAVVIGYVVLQRAANEKAAKEVDRALAPVQAFAQITYGGVHYGLLSGSLRVEDIRIEVDNWSDYPDEELELPEPVLIDRLVIEKVDRKSEVPTYLALSVDGIQLDPALLEMESSELAWMGYTNTLRARLRLDYVYDAEERELQIRDYTIGVDELGSLSLSLHLGNLNLSDEMMMLMMTYPQILVYGGALSWEDDSVTQRAMEAQARDQGRSVEELREEWLEDLKEEQAAAETPFERQALEAIEDYIQKPRRLTVMAAPDSPVALSRFLMIEEPLDLVDLLSLEWAAK
jgi:hypothetical protein